MNIKKKMLLMYGAASVASDWILALGFWNDSGAWDDTAYWID